MAYWYLAFYLPPLLTVALVVIAIVRPRLRRACGSAALWGLGLGTAVFLVGFIGPMLWASGANQGPLLGFFVGPFGFIVGVCLGFALALLRESREAPQATNMAPGDAYLPEPDERPPTALRG